MSGLAEHPNGLQPSEDFLDPFTLSLTDRIPGMACSSVIDGARPVARVLSYMRRYPQTPGFFVFGAAGLGRPRLRQLKTPSL
jgi:hypothetical protein